MARRRLRIRRFFGVALLGAALLGLLELNQLLPGGWPGGGGKSGFRAEFDTGDDADRLRPGLGDVAWPSDGVTVTVIAADGTPGRDWHLDLSDGRRFEADREGRVRLGATSRPLPFFGVTLGGRAASHTPADPTLAADWVVHMPAGAPAAEPHAGTRLETLTVVAAESGAPLPGAVVEVLAQGWARTKKSGADGRIVLALLPGPQEAVVGHPDRRSQRIWLHPADRGPRRVELERLVRRSLVFLDAEDGKMARIERVRVLAPDGALLFEAESNGGAGLTTIDLEVGERESAHAVLEVGGGAYPFYRLPLAAVVAEVRLPKGRRVDVRVMDPRSQPLSNVRLTAYYVPPALVVGGGLRERVEVEVVSRESVVLPTGVTAELRAEAAYSTPGVVTLGPSETGPIPVKLDPGNTLPVTVADEAGRPLVGATVIVRTEVGGRLVEREVRTDAAGSATLDELPATALEVYAHAPRRAWSVTTAKATRRMDPIAFRLVPGSPLRLVTETPLGIPLERVRVRVEPEGGGAPDVVPPHAPPSLTNASGSLVLPSLRQRAYRVSLSHPDAVTVHLNGVVPGKAVHFVTLVAR